MNVLDAIIAAPIVFGAYKGFQKGFLMEFVTFLALGLALVASFFFMNLGVTYLEPHLGKHSLLPVLSFILIFIGVLIGVFYLGKIVKTILDITLFGTLDNFLGGLFGIMKWALVFSVFLWLFDKGGIILPKKFTSESLLFPYLASYAPLLMSFLADVLPMTNTFVDEITELLTKFSKS